MSMTLVPTISSLHSNNNLREIRELLISSVRYSLYLVLPIVLILVIFGDAVMQFWMGPRYANSLLLAMLALGYLATLVQTPVLSILSGLNSHGRAGIAQLIASICSTGLVFLALGYLNWGIVGAAIAVILPLAIMNIFYLPVLVCRRVDLNVKRYFLSIIIRPVIHILPFTFCLIAARYIFIDTPLKGLFWGGLTGCTTLAIIYYRFVLPERIRIYLKKFVLITE